jgi:hypothetical protein
MNVGSGFITALTRRLTPDQWAAHCAYLLAPSLVLTVALAGVYNRGLVFDLAGPISFTELKGEIQADGSVTSRDGVVVMLDASPAEARVPLTGATGRLWSSLSAGQLVANKDHLRIENGVLSSRTPLLGTAGPSTLVVEGRLLGSADVPGGSESTDLLRLPDSRVTSILASVLLACVFAMGMALASTGHSQPNQHRTRKIAT